jgi:sulfur-oxidizing protein SoxX
MKYASILISSALLASTNLRPAVLLAETDAATGRSLFLAPKKGNCAACHQVPNDPNVRSAANIGPPLENMTRRFPDAATLRRIIEDASRVNPASIMPPYQRHRILDAREIDAIIAYLASI